MRQVFYILIFSLLFFTQALSCSCGYMTMSVKKINMYDIVVKAEIVEKEIADTIFAENGDSLYHHKHFTFYKYTVRVDQKIKPGTIEDYITVYSNVQGATCGVNYSIGDNYYLFIYKDKTHGSVYTTGLCSGNQKVEKANRAYKKVIKDFIKGTKLKDWCDENGNLIARGLLVNSYPNGQWEYFHKDGTLESSGVYQMGVMDGKWDFYRSERYSLNLFESLDDVQKSQVSDPKNILYRFILYKNGERTDVVNVFSG